MTVAASRLLATLTEKEFQATVIETAHRLGWRVAHFRTAMTARGAYVTPVAADGAGFPDLCMVKGERVVFCELKAAKGRLGKEQKLWLNTLLEAGQETYVARPADLDALTAVLATGGTSVAWALRAATRKETQQ